jgi:hypothetical protein
MDVHLLLLVADSAAPGAECCAAIDPSAKNQFVALFLSPVCPRRSSAPQEPDIQVGTPNRGKTQRIRTM